MKAVLITVGNYLVFVVWLGIHLPKGFWQGRSSISAQRLLISLL